LSDQRNPQGRMASRYDKNEGESLMKYNFALPNVVQLKALDNEWEKGVDGAAQTAMVKRADKLGYDMVCVPEHFLIPNEHIELSGAHYFDSATGMAYLAGATDRIRVNSCLTILPLHNPVLLAKALSTIDWMSGGRLTCTFGVGWLKEEFDLLGIPFHERGRMSDEYLAAMIALWTEESPSFEGQYVSFKDAAFEPKPVQRPHVPIWMGGDADGALKRAARFATGWIPYLTKEADIPARIDFITSQPEYRGGPFEVYYSLVTSAIGEGHVAQDNPEMHVEQSVQYYVDRVGALAELGVTHTTIPALSADNAEAYMDHAQWVIEEIKPRVG
jgi:probable F420-dependent oxidoreductase